MTEATGCRDGDGEDPESEDRIEQLFDEHGHDPLLEAAGAGADGPADEDESGTDGPPDARALGLPGHARYLGCDAEGGLHYHSAVAQTVWVVEADGSTAAHDFDELRADCPDERRSDRVYLWVGFVADRRGWEDVDPPARGSIFAGLADQLADVAGGEEVV